MDQFSTFKNTMGPLKKYVTRKIAFLDPPMSLFFQSPSSPCNSRKSYKLWNNQDEFFRIFDCLSKDVIFKEIDSRGLLLFYNV